MKLNGIFLYPDLVEYQCDAALLFRNQTRFICNYVQRKLVAQQFQVNGFNKICVVCKSAPVELTYKNSSNALIAEVRFDMAEYEKLEAQRLPEYFIELLESGINKCCKDRHFSNEYFLNAIQSFRAEGYKNEWIYSKKTFRAAGLKCSLQCRLDIAYFRLMLEIERNGQLVFFKEILRTLPDELMYSHRFKDINFDGDAVIVQDKFGQSLVRVPLKGL